VRGGHTRGQHIALSGSPEKRDSASGRQVQKPLGKTSPGVEFYISAQKAQQEHNQHINKTALYKKLFINFIKSCMFLCNFWRFGSPANKSQALFSKKLKYFNRAKTSTANKG